MESPSDVRKFLFRLDNLSGSKGSLEQLEENTTPAGTDPLPSSPQPDSSHLHELEIIEEINEADNQSESGDAKTDCQKDVKK